MSLFLLASGALATFIYFSYSKTPYLEARGKQTDNPIKDVTTFVSHYTEPDDGWSNPNNLTTNLRHVKEIFSESGPYGVPRVYYTGPGNSKLVNYGRNLTSI